MKMWFQSIFGSSESDSFLENRDLFDFNEKRKMLYSKGNGRYFKVGPFEILSNQALHVKICEVQQESDRLTFENICGDVKVLLRDPDNSGAVFQVASQFNCLEMVGPNITPEMGITMYAYDPTQGPACALACPAATVFRNYFVHGVGQGFGNQVDLLADVGKRVDNDQHGYWEMRNGYALPLNPNSILSLSERLLRNDELANDCRSLLQVGVHWSTEVSTINATERSSSSSLNRSSHSFSEHSMSPRSGTMVRTMTDQGSNQRAGSHGHNVCQVFASALPVAYASKTPQKDWAPFAAVILDSAYDSTLAVGHILAIRKQIKEDAKKDVDEQSDRVTVFLTALGGGAFGNRMDWIIKAIERALDVHSHAPLDVKLVHYGDTIPSAFRSVGKRYWKSTSPVGKSMASSSKDEASLQINESLAVSEGAAQRTRRSAPAVLEHPAEEFGVLSARREPGSRRQRNSASLDSLLTDRSEKLIVGADADADADADATAAAAPTGGGGGPAAADACGGGGAAAAADDDICGAVDLIGSRSRNENGLDRPPSSPPAVTPAPPTPVHKDVNATPAKIATQNSAGGQGETKGSDRKRNIDQAGACEAVVGAITSATRVTRSREAGHAQHGNGDYDKHFQNAVRETTAVVSSSANRSPLTSTKSKKYFSIFEPKKKS